MDDKDLKKEEEKEELDGVNGADIADSNDVNDETGEWKFDGESPMLNDEIELNEDYSVDVSDEEAPSDGKAAAAQTTADNGEKNKKNLKIVLAALAGAVAASLIIALCVFVFALPNTNEKMTPGNVALKVGDTKVSVGMYNYYYGGIVQNYLQSAQYGYNTLDPNVDYGEQFTVDEDGNEITWLECFQKDTISQIQYNLAYYEAGVENGIKLTDEQKEAIDEKIESLEKNASELNISVGEYLKDSFGEYCGVATVKKIFEQSTIASTYYRQVLANNEIDKDEYNKYFEENQNKYFSSKFSAIEILADGTDENSLAKLEEDVKNYQSQITDTASIKKLIPAACDNLIEQYMNYGYFVNKSDAVKALEGSVEMTIPNTTLEEQFGSEIVEWFKNDDVPIGSTKYYINKDYGFAYIFLKTDKPFLPQDEIYSVRHILVMPEPEVVSEDPAKQEYTQAEWDAALKKANEILDLYNKGEKTELSFALLAEEKSDDKESTSKGAGGFYGGAIEGVPLGQMVPEFEAWSVDKSRKYGDVEIVKSQFGYHIMYFIFDGPQYEYNAMSDFKNEKIIEFEKELAEKYAVKEKIAMKKTDKAEPVTVKKEEESTDNAQ